VAPFAQRFAEAPAVVALRESLPVALVAAAVFLLAQVVLPHLPALSQVVPRLRDAIPGAFALASIVMVFVLATRLALRLGYPLAPALAATVVAFAFALPRDARLACAELVRSGGASGLGAFARTLGVSGLFTAIVVALAAAGAFELARRRLGERAGPWAAGLLVVALAWALDAADFSLAAGLATAIAPLATLGDSFVALLAITALESVLFLVGIHGPALLAALILPVYVQLQFENSAAAHAHLPLPHVVVVSTFLFVFPGGAGATLPLVLLLLRSPVARLKKFAFATLVPSLLNVNEPVIFGLPVAYNPVLAVPFVLAPVALACTTYAAMALGLVGRPVYYVPSSIPSLVSAFLATLDWRACVLMAFNAAVAGAIWLPFVRVYERTEGGRVTPAGAVLLAANGVPR
jgi:PTS system cellobiose-specific IIC component